MGFSLVVFLDRPLLGLVHGGLVCVDSGFVVILGEEVFWSWFSHIVMSFEFLKNRKELAPVPGLNT